MSKTERREMDSRIGGNPSRVAAIQQLRRSGAYGTHKQKESRSEQNRQAIRESRAG